MAGLPLMEARVVAMLGPNPTPVIKHKHLTHSKPTDRNTHGRPTSHGARVVAILGLRPNIAINLWDGTGEPKHNAPPAERETVPQASKDTTKEGSKQTGKQPRDNGGAQPPKPPGKQGSKQASKKTRKLHQHRPQHTKDGEKELSG
jgi:hypothetical protein